MKLRNTYRIFLGTMICLLASSCSILRKSEKNQAEVELPLVIYSQPAEKSFKNINKTISIWVDSEVAPSSMYDDEALKAISKKLSTRIVFTPDIRTFVLDATKEYMQKMRFDIASSGDFRMEINVKTFMVKWINNTSAEGIVKLQYRVTDKAGETIMPSKSVSVTVKLHSHEQFGAALGRAYAAALKKIKWDKIAKIVSSASSPADDDESVSGDEDSSLEDNIIRWYITSSPQGADLSWRILSSTPGVANTNANYIGSTPFESTESFDIKGLNVSNSGNVQIEITCEKRGYITQKKRFNLRQVIDQKEISAKFNLIKE